MQDPFQEVWSEVETLQLIDSVRAYAAERGEVCEWGREVNLRLENVDAWNLSRDRTLERDIYTYIIFVTEAKYAIFYKQDIISCL